MKNLLPVFVCAVTTVVAWAQPQVTAGLLEHIDVYSPEMGREMPIDIWLPPGYDTQQRYPVVYMHDGQNLFDASTTWNHQSWEVDSVAGLLIDEDAIKAPIVVGIYSQSRSRVGDLMPTEVTDMIVGHAIDDIVVQMCPDGIKGDKYVDFIALTLKPLIDSKYPTLTDIADTSVAGSSMGGLASLYALCRHPEVFGSSACLSTHLTGRVGENEIFPGALMGYLVGNLPTDGLHRIYLDTGDQDIDAHYLPYFHRVTALLEECGYEPGASLLSLYFPGEGHSESYWSQRLRQSFTFLLGK